MPIGYLTSAILPGVCVLATLAPRRSPGVLATACFLLGFINELPFLAAYLLIASTVLAAAEGDLNTPVGWVAFAISLLTLAGLAALVVRALPTGAVFERALAEHMDPPTTPTARVPLAPMLLWPFFRRRFDVRRIANVRYADARLNTLDVYRHRARASGRPVFVHLHGGAFAGGRKNQESLPLIYHLARQGWICVSANYRRSPAASRQDQVADVGKVIGWVHERINGYGGDPSTIVLAGGSAGAHLAASATLRAVDRSIRATVMLYAYYGDLGTIDAPRGGWARGAGGRGKQGAPPFLVIHGANDTLVPVEDARRFVERLRATSPSPVIYAELPGAGHAFDIFHSPRSRAVIAGTDAFLQWVRARTRPL